MSYDEDISKRKSHHMSRSLYYGQPSLANVYSRHLLQDLLRDLESDKLEPEIRVQIEAELARRAARKSKHSK